MIESRKVESVPLLALVLITLTYILLQYSVHREEVRHLDTLIICIFVAFWAWIYVHGQMLYIDSG